MNTEFKKENVEHYILCSTFDNFIKEYNPKLLNNYSEFINSERHIILDNQEFDHSELIEWYIVWFLIFHNYKTIVVLDRCQRTAVEILDRCKDIFDLLPIWMKPPIEFLNKRQFVLSNYSKIVVDACNQSSIKGISINLLYIVNLSEVNERLANEFMISNFPVVCSSKHSKIIVTGNYNGNDTYKKLVTNTNDCKEYSIFKCK